MFKRSREARRPFRDITRSEADDHITFTDLSGDGGNIEISGHENLVFGGEVDAGGVGGLRGVLGAA